MENVHQKNLRVVLSMEQKELAAWLADLPDTAIGYVEWLIEETECALDDMILEHTGLEEANNVLDKIKKL